ncbi:hypothetical protein [Neobacillus sp. SAB-20_R2A]|uniref:hypothetical protein n=1 Tax=Neobacillus sp. SAB-20_R2A TaxID=3120519 RepID=UPI003C6DEE72
MNVQKGISVFAFLGICGAALFATVPLWYGLWQETLFLTTVDITAHTLLLMGMIGIYFANAEKLGNFGLISGILLIPGFVFHIFMKAASGFFKPILFEYAPQVLANGTVPSPLAEIINVSMILFPLSIFLFGIAIAVSKMAQRKIGFLLMFSPFGFLVPFGVFISPLLFSFIVISLAYPIVSGKNKNPEWSLQG